MEKCIRKIFNSFSILFIVTVLRKEWNNKIICFALFLLYVTRIVELKVHKSPIVQTAQGKLQGQILKDYYGRDYYSYRGIPYAQAPVKELRFQSPQPPTNWEGVRNAVHRPPPCPQRKTFFKVPSSEDCLFLNVYTTSLNGSSPVLFNIHGGGFTIGAAAQGPEFMMQEHIVLVEIQYRLNIFGFMNLRDPSLNMSLNAGLKDQVQALKWVQQNIHAFGGDKNQVTIAGESAGATSVQLLYVSPKARGLFHRAIAQSGSISLPWMYGKKNRYFQLAQRVGCKSRKKPEILECLRKVPTDVLMQEYEVIETNSPIGHGQLSAFNLITLEESGDDAFLQELPEVSFQKGYFEKLPYLTGFNSHEGNTFKYFNLVKPNFLDNELLIPSDLNITLDTETSRTLGQDIQELYYGKLTPSNELLEPFINYLTDFMFVEKQYHYAKVISEHAPVYFYVFDYNVPRLNCIQPSCHKEYVGHGEELGYLFYFEGKTPNDIEPGSDEDVAIRRVVKMFTQFIKTGNPNSEDPLLEGKVWNRFSRRNMNYLQISKNLKLLKNPIDERMKFWEKVYKYDE